MWEETGDIRDHFNFWKFQEKEASKLDVNRTTTMHPLCLLRRVAPILKPCCDSAQWTLAGWLGGQGA